MRLKQGFGTINGRLKVGFWDNKSLIFDRPEAIFKTVLLQRGH
jgi:hypothetical protein